MAVAVCIYSNAVFLIVQSAFCKFQMILFLNQVLSGHMVLEYDFAIGVCVCVPPPRLFNN